MWHISKIIRLCKEKKWKSLVSCIWHLKSSNKISIMRCILMYCSVTSFIYRIDKNSCIKIAKSYLNFSRKRINLCLVFIANYPTFRRNSKARNRDQSFSRTGYSSPMASSTSFCISNHRKIGILVFSLKKYHHH